MLKTKISINEEIMLIPDYIKSELENNYNFANEFDAELAALGGERLYKYGSSVNRAVSNRFDTQGHRLGGYAHFNQTDPRRANAEYRKYDRLLLQADSHGELISFGTDGTAKFFISSENLASGDFSDILYVWDEP